MREKEKPPEAPDRDLFPGIVINEMVVSIHRFPTVIEAGMLSKLDREHFISERD